jgi:hypothetical protein
MNSKKINQLATELTPSLSDLTIIGDPSTGVSKKITLSQMASLFTGTVEEYPSFASLPLVGVADTIYIATDTNILYRWDTTLSAYAELSPNIVTSLVFSDANGFDGTISLVGSVATLTITTALTQGSVPFIGASGALSQDNDNFFWDDTNNRLGIGTKLPTTALDVFGSGIIGRVNGTSTNNAFLGFASAGTNKWSIGNVQSDHRFRIYSEANTSELVSVLQTGEFGIGIANPTTKFHIDGGASALIANLDANISVAKSVSFRSDNSARINLEVSGTESGSNAGADLFIKRYSDAGALLDTAFFVKRSTGNIGIGTTSPISTLDVSSSSPTITIRNNSQKNWNSGDQIGYLDQYIDDTSSAGARIVSYIRSVVSAGVTSGITVASDLIFGTSGYDATATEKMRINNSGYVGINNTSPSARLDVSGTIRATAQTDPTSGTGLELFYRGADSASYIQSYDRTNSAWKDIRMFGNNLIFGTSDTARLTISPTGGYTLAGANAVTISSQVGSNADIIIDRGSSSNAGYISWFNPSGSRLGYMGYSTTNLGITLNGSANLVVTGGNVLVGTTTAIGSPFQVQGNTWLENASAVPQYVNRTGNDGGLIVFLKAGTQVGVIATNTYTLPSDINFKKNINTLDLGLNLVTKLRPVSYNHKIDDNDAALSTGFIAQELEKSLEELGVEENKYYLLQHKPNEKEGESQYWVDYQKFIPVLVNAIKEQQAQIEELKALINK